MKIAVDAMGSDQGSGVFIEPVKKFASDHNVEIWVYGHKEELRQLEGAPGVKVVGTTQVMAMDDGPLAVRRKADSSMVRAVQDLKEGKVDGVMSCGSTGALLSSGSMILRNIPGIERAAILVLAPSAAGKPFAFLDLGANAAVTAQELVGFGIIGKAYMQADQGIADPSVGLLNIGAEEHKGDDVHREAFQLMRDCGKFRFAGNVEANHLLDGKTDVVVADGFSGNIAEKAVEGTASFLLHMIKEKLKSGGFSARIGGLLIRNSLSGIKSVLDPNRFGGALIAGLSAPVVKAHGNSNEEALYNAMAQLYRAVDRDIVGKIRKDLA